MDGCGHRGCAVVHFPAPVKLASYRGAHYARPGSNAEIRMSGIAAIIRFDGKPVAKDEIARLTGAMAYRGADGIAHHLAGSAALGHCMLRTTAESMSETQPLANEDASVVLVFDGFLSHPLELREELLARGTRLRDRTDAELVLRAYETWGEDCPRHIDGEFAFLLWDERRRTTFCAKDVAGMRPLHYHRDARRLIVASDIAGVVAAGDFDLAINRGMAAEHLANEWHSLDETIWANVMRVPPASSMSVDASRTRIARYWEPSSARRRGSDDDVAEEYREMLADCVRRASRTHAPLACDLSGGLDSSAIFALAHRELGAGRLLAPSIDAYSYEFDAGRPENEIEYARAVADWVGAGTTAIRPFLPELDWFAERGRADRDIAPYPNVAMMVGVGDAIVANGSRVSLNGEGGDEFLVGHPFHYNEHFHDRDWRGFARSLRTDLAALGLTETGRLLWRYGLSPLAPMRLRHWRRTRRDRVPRGWHSQPYRWLPDDMQQALRERRAQSYLRQDAYRNKATSFAYMRGVVQDGFTTYAHDYASRMSARIGYERRSPMYARAFIEFAFALNSEQRIRGGRPKEVHVRALTGLLPPKVLSRTEKVDFVFPYDRLLDTACARMLDTIPHCSMELAGAETIDALCHDYRNRPSAFVPRHEIWTLYSLGNLHGVM